MQPHNETPLTLGEIEAQLKSAIASHDDGENASIMFDFGGAYPTGCNSFRNIPWALCLEFSGDYKNNGKTAGEFLESIELAYKDKFEAWSEDKSYCFHADSDVYVACSGCGSNTRVIGIEAREECIKILTAEIED
jgi:hypothetical protein